MPDAARATSPSGRSGDVRPERRIRGRTLAERRGERREALLAAGLDLFGTRGFSATTVEDVCRRAYVSSRNFYEEFDNRRDLLVAVGEQIAAAAFAACTDATAPVDLDAGDSPGASGAVAGRVRARVSSLVHTLVDDPRVARVAFVETVGLDTTDAPLRRQILGMFPVWLATYLQDHLDGRGVSRRRQERLASGLVGAVHELMTDWVLRAPEARGSVEDLVDDIADFTMMVLTAHVRGTAAR